MKLPTPDEMRARFAELTAQADAIRAKSMTLREKRDRVANEARAAEVHINAGIREIEDGLFDIEQERAMIARALGGKTGAQAVEPAAE